VTFIASVKMTLLNPTVKVRKYLYLPPVDRKWWTSKVWYRINTCVTHYILFKNQGFLLPSFLLHVHNLYYSKYSLYQRAYGSNVFFTFMVHEGAIKHQSSALIRLLGKSGFLESTLCFVCVCFFCASCNHFPWNVLVLVIPLEATAKGNFVTKGAMDLQVPLYLCAK